MQRIIPSRYVRHWRSLTKMLDEILAERDGDLDADSRWALAWFEESGFADGEFGVAETLSKAKDTSVSWHGRGGYHRIGRP